MIQIHKFENVYGIKKLRNPNLIDRNTIIYSPNGVMKSSLTDGLLDISLDQNPNDVFNNLAASFTLKNNGVSISETTTPKHLDLVVFKGEDIFDSVFTDKDIAKIVVSPALKKQYETKIASIKDKIDKIKEILASNVLDEKKGAKSKKIDDFLVQFSGGSELEQITALFSTEHSDIKEDCSTISYTKIFNTKTEAILNDSTFKQKCEEFQKLKDAKLDENVFNSSFGITQLENSHKNLVTNKYYDAGHKLQINKEILDKLDVDKLIEDSIKTAYGSEDMKDSFLAAKKVLDANKDSREIVNAITENNWLLEKLTKPLEFKINLIFKKIEDFETEIDLARKEIDLAQKEIEKIYAEANKTEAVWKSVIDTYNHRFNNKHFDIIITNQVNAIIGIQEPVFTKVLKTSGHEITEAIFKRFSSGEKRAIFILYFLFEIELKRMSGIPYTIVADDIVDSFDYKNKYAMIEYLSELSLDPNVQLIILTHNFDFYRSACISLGGNLNSRLFGYIDTNDDVSLFNANSSDYESFELFRSWKTKDDVSSLIALVPFLRNLVELQEGNSSPNYAVLCNYLHYNLSTPILTLAGLGTIYTNNGILHTSASSITTYWNLLIQEVKTISSPVVESDIKKKIILGLFIRLASDFFLLEKYKSNNGGADPAISSGSNWTKQLKKLSLQYLTVEEKRLYDRAVTVAPSFIHVNSFMYEPLIDVGSEKLLSIAQELIIVNSL
ncbi:hypothetical protein BK010_07280 [Tenericutes bacterium MO-XQ]|nr:hypothetical protein BK010_07280 [Tenericutes bacterium MO-XQ]